ncbi:MAG: DEAD/DEAH box helicase, partial [Bacteroidaceae bacterium]|nr:DEAD/DEAH box helicase [Bacteroidaceae bacterium]
MMFADVLLPVPLPGLFTYAVPAALKAAAQAGCRVQVPFGTTKSATGLIVRCHHEPPTDSKVVVKDIIDILDADPVILPEQYKLWQWMSEYYLCAIGEVFKAALPAKLKKRGKLMLSERLLAPESMSLPALSPAQQTALSDIRVQWQQHPVCLLHGVTSSGKTELYIHLIAEALERGEQVLYLLPEIVLTTQLTNRLKAVFGERLGVYHSKFTDKERAEVWMRQLSANPYDIIVGVRSSVFLPFQRLGLVIVDEEHEVNFKQQDPAPRYNARNVAILMASRAKARTLLGTATPSFESYYNARRGKYGLVALHERFGQVQLPDVEIIDVKEL